MVFAVFRNGSAMEDSTAMTIEFLRARLLSERSVSRTARQRADQLAKRVVELEEHLKIVSIQRKKAEKAAADVLSILENHGISDLSEAFDSSSEQDGVLSESKENNNSVKEEEGSLTSLLKRTNVEDGLSGSELEGSPSLGRSLSWKSGSNFPNSLEKNSGQARQRQRTFLSTGGSSPKQRLGKSCRKIKRRETRSAAEDISDAPPLFDAQENGKAVGVVHINNHINDRPEFSNEGSKNEDDNAFTNGLISCQLEGQRKENDVSIRGSDRDVEMEKALEQQARLIGQYEAEENAQREWEEKFRENNSCTPDSCEPGNQSDITEERNEPKTESPEQTDTIPSYDTSQPGDTILSYDRGAKPKIDDICESKDATSRTPGINFMPTDQRSHGLHVNMEHLLGQHGEQMVANNASQDFVIPGQEYQEAKKKGKQSLDWSEKNSDNRMSSDWKFQALSHGSPEIPSLQNSSLGGESFSKGESPRSQNRRGVPQQLPSGFQEFGFPIQDHAVAKLKGKQNLEHSENSPETGMPGYSTFQPVSHRSREVQPIQDSSSFHGGGNLSKGESTGSQNSQYGMPHQIPNPNPNPNPNPLGGVLEALQFAKLSLQNEFDRSMPPNQATALTVSDTQNWAIKASNTLEIPLGSTGLFRVPSELQSSSSSQADFSRPNPDFGFRSSSSSQADFSRPYPDFGLSLTRHSSDVGVGIMTTDRYPANPYIESGSRASVSGNKPYFKPYMDPAMGMPPSNRYTYPYSESTARMPSNERFPKPYSDVKALMPAPERYSPYDVKVRSNMRRQ
ncbi:transcriptional regulator ATRX isoform X2 [Tasmannia lanceolata]|uniref:transcriptional regulator ATRX isoform X2 n=1 Tax=Tasmannia lanceolata TaxID=3420 RepID=UPI0040641628